MASPCADPPPTVSGTLGGSRTEELDTLSKNGTLGESRMDTTSGTLPESRSKNTNSPLPTFYILHSLTETPLGNLSPFVVQKSLDGLVGTVKKVTKMRSGDLLVETPNSTISRNLERVKAIGDCQIVVTPHSTLNYSRGVVVSRDLISVSEKELLEGMSSQGVIAVKRIMLRKDGRPVPSRVLIISFDRPKLPDSVKAGYIHCSVQPYIPNPLRCFACQRFGHSKTSCRGTPICARCAGIEHDFEACEADPVCVNCQGKHPAYSRSCPKWQIEKGIQRYRVEKGVSYPEARRAVIPTSNRPSYASVAQVHKITVETQTPVSVPPDTSFSTALPGLTQRTTTCFCGHLCTPRPQTSSVTQKAIAQPVKQSAILGSEASTSDARSQPNPKQASKTSDPTRSPPKPSQPPKAELRKQVSKPAPTTNPPETKPEKQRINRKQSSSSLTKGEHSSPSDLGSSEDLFMETFEDPLLDRRDRSPIREGRKKRSKMKITPP